MVGVHTDTDMNMDMDMDMDMDKDRERFAVSRVGGKSGVGGLWSIHVDGEMVTTDRGTEYLRRYGGKAVRR